MIERETTSTFNKVTGSPRKRFYPSTSSQQSTKAIRTFLFHSPLVNLIILFIALRCSLLHRIMTNPKRIQFADIGSGFGGQLVAFSTQFPDKLMIGMKIRDKVTECVKERISALRTTNPNSHFKQKNHCRGVISPHLLDEYAYTLAVEGKIYTITDVEELGEWMKGYLENHPMFEALMEEELVNDPVVKLLTKATEKGQKVVRNGG